MEQLIRLMITDAHSQGEHTGYKLMEYVRELLDVLAKTQNAPSDWREIGTALADEWNNGTLEWSDEWVYKGLDLFNFGADEFFGVATLGQDG